MEEAFASNLFDSGSETSQCLSKALTDCFSSSVLWTKPINVKSNSIFNQFLFQEINHFLSVSVSDALPLTRLEGMKDLQTQSPKHKKSEDGAYKSISGY